MRARPQNRKPRRSARRSKPTATSPNRGFGVVLTKGSEGTVLSFIVRDGIWDDATQVQGYTELGRAVAPAVGGLPMKVRIVNTAVEPKKEIPLS